MIGGVGRKSEELTLKRLGARPTPASGAIPGGAGDGEVDDYVIECKSTTSLSLSLKLEHLQKVTHEAQASGQTGVLHVAFTMHGGRSLPAGNWMVIPEWLWLDLTR